MARNPNQFYVVGVVSLLGLGLGAHSGNHPHWSLGAGGCG